MHIIWLGLVLTLRAGVAEELDPRADAELVGVMLSDPEEASRREAAELLTARLADDAAVLEAIIEGLAYPGRPDAVPWEGGPLLLPRGSYERLGDRRLIEALLAWQMYCDRRKQEEDQRQIYINLQKIELLRGIGFGRLASGETEEMLITWGRYAGRDAVDRLLREQGWLYRIFHLRVLADLPRS